MRNVETNRPLVVFVVSSPPAGLVLSLLLLLASIAQHARVYIPVQRAHGYTNVHARVRARRFATLSCLREIRILVDIRPSSSQEA